jgi:predicted small secreted protein
MIKLVLTVTFGCLALLAGCNTMEGLGEDIERGGEKIQDKAKR